MNELKELIEYIVKALVDNPEKVEIKEIAGEKSIIYELKVGEGDLGKVIGKEGRTAKAVRTIITADAIVAGCIVLPLERELGFMGNYLDLLENEYDIVRSVPYELIKQRLEEIFISRRRYYTKEFAKIRIRLINGLNPVNDEFLQCFLPDHFLRANEKHK